MKAKQLNKQLAAYVARALADVPKRELIDYVTADNSFCRTSNSVGVMRVTISTIVPNPKKGGVVRKLYQMTSTGLALTGQECELDIAIVRLTKERDNARELVRLSKEVRASGNVLLVIQEEIMKRAPGEHEYDVLMKRIVYSHDWVTTFLEEVERLDSHG